MLNITEICEMLPEQILELAHKTTAVPALIIGFILSFLIILIIGMITFDTSKGRKKFFIVWLISLFVIGIVYIFLSLSPNFVQTMANLFQNLWS